ncbi:MAG: hypothetical protein NXH95_08735 [Pseudomonadaceae bacterium]|nr:hypothetical protein [Pseudomonadaceae bacterium]
MSNTLHNPRLRPLLFLVTAALLVQSLFPAGTMPGSLSSGWVATLCPEGMPVGFMAQLQPLQKQVGQHAGHHNHHDGHHAGGVDHSAGHQATGDCQLGSQLDQPFTLASVYTPVAALQVESVLVQNRTSARLARDVYHPRPRGPPLS